MTAAAETILVVDDAPQNVKLLRLILRDAGYRVIEAFNGPEALDKLRREHPAAMILDVRMPGMSGYEVCREVRADPGFATLPIIMVTALSMPEERIKGIEAGATDFITKPFDKKELLARLQASLELVRAEARGCLDRLEAMVVVTDADWHIVGVSAPAAKMLGLDGEDRVGADLLGLLRERDGAISQSELENGTPFALQGSDGRRLVGRTTAVGDTSDRLLLRVTVLQEVT